MAANLGNFSGDVKQTSSEVSPVGRVSAWMGDHFETLKFLYVQHIHVHTHKCIAFLTHLHVLSLTDFNPQKLTTTVSINMTHIDRHHWLENSKHFNLENLDSTVRE